MNFFTDILHLISREDFNKGSDKFPIFSFSLGVSLQFKLLVDIVLSFQILQPSLKRNSCLFHYLVVFWFIFKLIVHIEAQKNRWGFRKHTCLYLVSYLQFRHCYWFSIFKTSFCIGWEAGGWWWWWWLRRRRWWWCCSCYLIQTGATVKSFLTISRDSSSAVIATCSEGVPVIYWHILIPINAGATISITKYGNAASIDTSRTG